jgi:hypothetical protein
MKKILILVTLFFIQQVSCQELTMDFELTPSPDVSGPKFNGGDATKFYEFINKEYDFTKVKKSGKMTVGFTVNESGELKNIKILEFPDTDSAIEMIRVLKLSPKWESANRGGKAFSTDLKLPFNFRLKIKEQVVNTNKTESEPDVNGVSQNDGLSSNENNISNTNKKTSIETAPMWPGGVQKFYEYIAKNYRTPYVEGLRGKVIVSFIVDTDGSLVNLMIVKDLGYGTGKEAIRVLKKCPKWTPGMQNGKPVRCEYTLPITIQTSN